MPLPISMMLILSMPASCVANAVASSGILSTTMLITAASLKFFHASAFFCRPSASASSFFLMTSASASPIARILAASARPTRSIFAAWPAPSNSSSRCVASARMTVACFSPSALRIIGLARGLGGLHDGRLEFLLLARGLLRLHQHFLLLADLVDAGLLFGDTLPGDRGRERPRLLGLLLLGLHSRVEFGLLRFLVPKRLRDGDVGLVAAWSCPPGRPSPIESSRRASPAPRRRSRRA